MVENKKETSNIEFTMNSNDKDSICDKIERMNNINGNPSLDIQLKYDKDKQIYLCMIDNIETNTAGFIVKYLNENYNIKVIVS